MNNSTNSTAVGVFTTRSKAQQAIADLKSYGFTEQQIGFVSRDENGSAKSGLKNDPTATRWEEGTGIGAAAGAVTGTGLGLAVMAGLISPVGPLVAGGALVALIASAGVGATVGTVIGGLVGLGIPEDDARFYEGEIHAGRYVVTVNAPSRTAEARAIFQRYQGYDRATGDMGSYETSNGSMTGIGGSPAGARM